MDIFHTRDEAVESLLLVIQQRVGWNDDFPLAIPHTSTHVPRVGKLCWDRAVEECRIANGAERLMLAENPWLFAEGTIGVKELSGVECRGPEIVGQRQRLVVHRPSPQRVGVAERWCEHAVATAGDQTNVRRCAERIGGVAWGAGSTRRAKGGPRKFFSVKVAGDFSEGGWFCVF